MPARKQLNVRVPEEMRDIFDAAIFVRDLRGPQELVQPALEGLEAELRRDPLVRGALELRTKGRAARGGRIHRLDTIRSRRSRT